MRLIRGYPKFLRMGLLGNRVNKLSQDAIGPFG